MFDDADGLDVGATARDVWARLAATVGRHRAVVLDADGAEGGVLLSNLAQSR
jgi:hypothetical protein